MKLYGNSNDKNALIEKLYEQYETDVINGFMDVDDIYEILSNEYGEEIAEKVALSLECVYDDMWR